MSTYYISKCNVPSSNIMSLRFISILILFLGFRVSKVNKNTWKCKERVDLNGQRKESDNSSLVPPPGFGAVRLTRRFKMRIWFLNLRQREAMFKQVPKLNDIERKLLGKKRKRINLIQRRETIQKTVERVYWMDRVMRQRPVLGLPAICQVQMAAPGKSHESFSFELARPRTFVASSASCPTWLGAESRLETTLKNQAK